MQNFNFVGHRSAADTSRMCGNAELDATSNKVIEMQRIHTKRDVVMIDIEPLARGSGVKSCLPEKRVPAWQLNSKRCVSVTRNDG